jgi:hypothetical protein
MTLPSTYPIAVLKNGTIQEADATGYPNKYAQLIMGNLPHGSAAPSWWKPSPGYEYLRTISWNRIVPWIVVLTGTGNRATNTRIEFRNIKAYYKSKSTGEWIKIGEGPIDGYNCPPGQWDNCGGVTDIVKTTQGTVSLKPAGTGSNFHGWGGSGNIANVHDVEIYFATLQARIVGGDASSAQYMVHVGTDFYAPGISVNEMGGYNPGTGHSRSKGLTTSWQSISYATLNSAPKMQNPNLGVSPSVFKAKPPPLD